MQTVLAAPDFGIPEIKPAIESICGVWVRKLSPKREHALMQARLCRILEDTFGELGEVGPEWRWAILPKTEKPSSLVPDVTYVSIERLPWELGEIREAAALAPDIAVEILSPGDNRRYLKKKIEIYLANGSLAVIVVDPLGRRVVIHECDRVNIFSGHDIATIDRYPQLRIDLEQLFRKL